MPVPRVVVTGLGLASAAGLGAREAWNSLQRSSPRPVTFRDDGVCSAIGFPVYKAPDYALKEAGVPERCVAWVAREGLGRARDLHHLLATTALALDDASLPSDCTTLEPAVALFVAGESPGVEELSRALFELDTQTLGSDPAVRHATLAPLVFRLNGFLLPFYLARAFGFRGQAGFVNAACLSGLTAMDLAAQAIRSGRARIAVVAAADNVLSAAKYLWFRRLGLYSCDGAVRPFDARHPGIVFGDGGACVVLESLGSARRRGAVAYAEYCHASFAQDGWKVTVPAATSEGAARALRGALAFVRRNAGGPDLLVPHGTGSAASDLYEAQALHQALTSGPWPAVTALKPLVGHNLAGSSLVETVLLILALASGVIPPTVGSEQPLPRYPVPLVSRWTPRSIEVAIKLTCAFGGFSAATVFRRCDSGRSAPLVVPMALGGRA
jgi:3-oxoacyl-[acyl-carrier-protein] synthase II